MIEKEKEEKTVYFKSERFPYLEIVLIPMGLKDAQGNNIRSVHARFGLDPKLGAGILGVTDKKVIHLLRESEAYKSGQIKEIDINPDDLKVVGEVKVKTGVRGSQDVRK